MYPTVQTYIDHWHIVEDQETMSSSSVRIRIIPGDPTHIAPEEALMGDLGDPLPAYTYHKDFHLVTYITLIFV